MSPLRYDPESSALGVLPDLHKSLEGLLVLGNDGGPSLIDVSVNEVASKRVDDRNANLLAHE